MLPSSSLIMRVPNGGGVVMLCSDCVERSAIALANLFVAAKVDGRAGVGRMIGVGCGELNDTSLEYVEPIGE